MFKRISKRLRGNEKQPPTATQPDQEPPTSPPKPAAKSSEKNKPELWSWGLLTGTYNPLPEDANGETTNELDNDTQQPPTHKANKS
ncbi:MAG: hypothetical protein Q9M16_01160 [Mariprofundus sp.]|nr:hypothetical protein [Mariprofundus sp.]